MKFEPFEGGMKVELEGPEDFAQVVARLCAVAFAKQDKHAWQDVEKLTDRAEKQMEGAGVTFIVALAGKQISKAAVEVAVEDAEAGDRELLEDLVRFSGGMAALEALARQAGMPARFSQEKA